MRLSKIVLLTVVGRARAVKKTKAPPLLCQPVFRPVGQAGSSEYDAQYSGEPAPGRISSSDYVQAAWDNRYEGQPCLGRPSGNR